MSWSRVQGANNYNGASTTSLAIALTSPASAGDLITVAFSLDGAGFAGVSSVTDSLGTAYSQVAAQRTGANNYQVYLYAGTLAASGTPTVTISTSTGILIIGSVTEWSTGGAGTPTLDGAPVTATGSGATATASSLTPSASDLAVAVSIQFSGAATPAQGIGWTSDYSVGNPDPIFISEYTLNQSAAIAPSATYSVSAAWAIVGAIWKATPSAGAIVPYWHLFRGPNSGLMDTP